MKCTLFSIAIIICALKIDAQNYLIDFAGSGASATVNTVKVENITSGTSLTIDGNDILSLTVITGLNSQENKYQLN